MYDRYCKLTTGTLDISLRKIMLAYYQGSELHINLAKFFVINASKLESMALELRQGDVGNKEAWITSQRALLQVEKRASKGARFDFVSHNGPYNSLLSEVQQVHDLSILHPFRRTR